jgi:hypothetical protein
MPTAPVVDPTHVFYFLAVVFLTGLVGAAAFGCFQTLLEARQHRADHQHLSGSFRHCRYCRWGNAVLHEESVRFEDRDRVTVRCYFCHSCGLPQWFVRRVPLTHFAQS